MTIDTKKARELAQRLKDAEQPIINLSKLLGVKLPDCTLLPEAAALLLQLAEAHDSMAKDAARYRWLRQPDPLKRAAHIAVLTHNGGWVASGEQADAAIDAAMGADQRGKK